MTKNVIDDRAIAKPPYAGPKKDKSKIKKLSPKAMKIMLNKLFAGR